MFVIGVIAACLAAVAYGMSTVLRALGARRVAQEAREDGNEAGQTNSSGGPSLQSTMSTFIDPAFILGTMLVVIGFAGGAVAARYLPLFLSQTIVSANLVVTALLSTIMLNIALHTRDWIAIWLVVMSLCMLGFSSSPHTQTSDSDRFHWVLFIATAALCVAALAGVYKMGKHGAIFGGACAGLLFGMIAIAVRVLHGVDPFVYLDEVLRAIAVLTQSPTPCLAAAHITVSTSGPDRRPAARRSQRRHRGARRRRDRRTEPGGCAVPRRHRQGGARRAGHRRFRRCVHRRGARGLVRLG